MKREFLKELGLTDDVIEKIMAQNGKDIEKEKGAAKEKEKEIEIIQKQLEEANKAIESYKDMDIDKIKQSASDWENKFKEQQKQYEDYKKDTLLEKELAKAKSKDVEILRSLIKKEDLVFKDNEVVGLDKQIKALRKDKAFLFETEGNSEQNQGQGTDGQQNDDTRFNPYVPAGSDGQGGSSMEQTINSIFSI